MVQSLTIPMIVPRLRRKAVWANGSRCAPVLQTDDGRGLTKVPAEVAEPGTDQTDGSPEVVRLNLHILGPMVDLKIARGVNHN